MSLIYKYLWPINKNIITNCKKLFKDKKLKPIFIKSDIRLYMDISSKNLLNDKIQ